MKKVITGLVLFGIIMTSHPSQAAFGGLRVGGMVGIALLQGKYFFTGPRTPEDDMKKRLSVISSAFGAYAGYLFELSQSKLVVGGEVYLLMPGFSTKIDLSLQNQPKDGTVSIKHSRSMGFAATVGMMMNPKVMAYLSLGLESASFEFKYDFDKTRPAATLSQTFKKKFNGFTPALGAVYKMSSHILIGAELSSPFFKKFKMHDGLPRTFYYRPVERRLVLKLSYLF